MTWTSVVKELKSYRLTKLILVSQADYTSGLTLQENRLWEQVVPIENLRMSALVTVKLQENQEKQRNKKNTILVVMVSLL